MIETRIPNATGFEVRVDGQTAESWSGILDGFADASIYQTWAYGAVRWGARNLSHLVVLRDGRTVAAAQVRIIRVPVLPTGMAYVRWGPMCQSKDDPPESPVLDQALECLKTEYCERRGMILRIVPNIYPDSVLADRYREASGKGGFRPCADQPLYRTVLVDLSPAAGDIRKRLDQKWRNQLNASERNGLDLEVTCEPSGYGEFERLYHIMRNAKRFDSAVDVGEFGRIQEMLGEPGKMRIFIARKDGEAVGALVCSLMGDTAIYLLGATNERARELKASYFLHWQAMMWLKEHGACSYDLGGIDPESNPGGYHFKSGFGGNDLTQVSAIWASGGLLGNALHQGIGWIRRCRR